MNDEIKEILEELENMYEISELEEQVNNINKVRDYITNLQQENSNLKFSNQALNNELGLKLYELDRLDEKRNELKKEELKEYVKLQQENERLKVKTKEQSLLLIDYQDMEQRYEDYKSRCEKAIEYIKYNDSDLYTFEPDYDYEENLIDNYEPSNFREDLLNILQNGSDSQ